MGNVCKYEYDDINGLDTSFKFMWFKLRKNCVDYKLIKFVLG